MQTKIYNIKDVNLIVGTKPITSLMGDGITITKREDDFTVTDDLNGSIIYNQSNNNTHSITIVVNPVSEDASYLKGLRSSGTLFPCYYENKITGDKQAFSGCVFQKSADKNASKEIKEISYTILVATALEIE